MSGESAAGTMETVAINAAKRRGIEPDMEALAKQRAAIEAVFAAQEDAFFTFGACSTTAWLTRAYAQNFGFHAENHLGRTQNANPNAFGMVGCVNYHGKHLIQASYCWKKIKIGPQFGRIVLKRNAMSDELPSERQAVFDYLKARDDIRGITLRGKAKRLKKPEDERLKNNFQAVRSDEEVVQDSSKMGNFFLTVRSCEVIIFVLHGAAMAGGLGWPRRLILSLPLRIPKWP